MPGDEAQGAQLLGLVDDRRDGERRAATGSKD